MRKVSDIHFLINGKKHHFVWPETKPTVPAPLLAFMVAAVIQGKVDTFDLAAYVEENDLWKYFKPVDAPTA